MQDKQKAGEPLLSLSKRFLFGSVALALIALITWTYVSVSVRNGVVVIPKRRGPDPVFDVLADPSGFNAAVRFYYCVVGGSAAGSLALLFGYQCTKGIKDGDQ